MILQHAQQFHLRGGCEFSDFIQEDGSAIRELKLADAPLGRAGEGAAFVSEKLGLQQCLRDRSAVDLDHALRRARTVSVNGARDHFLAGSGLTLDQDRGIGRRRLADQLVELLHCGAFADDFGFLDSILLEAICLELPDAAPVFNRPPELNTQLVKIQRLGQVVESSYCHGFDGDRAGAIGRHDQDCGRIGGVAQLTHERQAVLSRHADVDQCSLDSGGGKNAGGLVPIGRTDDFVPFVLQQGTQRFPRLLLIFGYEDRNVMLQSGRLLSVGSRNTKFVPDEPVSNSSTPPWLATISRDTARPRPLPFGLVVK